MREGRTVAEDGREKEGGKKSGGHGGGSERGIMREIRM